MWIALIIQAHFSIISRMALNMGSVFPRPVVLLTDEVLGDIDFKGASAQLYFKRSLPSDGVDNGMFVADLLHNTHHVCQWELRNGFIKIVLTGWLLKDGVPDFVCRAVRNHFGNGKIIFLISTGLADVQ